MRYSEGDLFDYLAANGAMKETAAATLMLHNCKDLQGVRLDSRLGKISGEYHRVPQVRKGQGSVSAGARIEQHHKLGFRELPRKVVPAVSAHPSSPLGRGPQGCESGEHLAGLALRLESCSWQVRLFWCRVENRRLPKSQLVQEVHNTRTRVSQPTLIGLSQFVVLFWHLLANVMVFQTCLQHPARFAWSVGGQQQGGALGCWHRCVFERRRGCLHGWIS